MKVLVTGGTGFIGSNLVNRLLRDGHEVCITGKSNEQKVSVNGLEIIDKDLTEIDWSEFGKLDAVFHKAANNDTTCLDKDLMFAQNVQSSEKLFKTVIDNGCKRIVYASSTAVYGNMVIPFIESRVPVPINPYGESKLALDKIAMKFARDFPDTHIVGLRYCNVYGPGENHKGKRASMVYQIAQQMKQGDPKIFENGEQSRDYIYVKDVVKANMLALKSQDSFVANCSSGNSTSFNTLIKILNKVTMNNKLPNYIPNPYGDRYQNHTLCNTNLILKKINFLPNFNIEQGIKDYFASGAL